MNRLRRLVVATLVSVAVVSFSGASALAAGGNNQEIDVTAFSFGYHGQPVGSVNRSLMTVRFRNSSTEDFHEMVFAKLAPAHARDSIATLIREVDNAFTNGDFGFLDGSVPSAFPGAPAGIVGGVFAAPGASVSDFVDVTRTGSYFFLCALREPDGTPHYHLGMIGTFRVSR